MRCVRIAGTRGLYYFVDKKSGLNVKRDQPNLKGAPSDFGAQITYVFIITTLL